MAGSFLFKTVDGGLNWFPISDTVGNIISFISKDVGYSANGATIYKTINGGYDWTQQYSNSGGIFNFFFLDSCLTYAVGTGIVLKTYNGGIPTPDIIVSGDSLFSTVTGSSYKWFLNDTLINQSQWFCIAQYSGNYKVIVESGGCFSDTSLQFPYSPLSISENNYVKRIKIYPNPAIDHITIYYGINYSALSGYTIRIHNLLGSKVFSSLINQQILTIDLKGWKGNSIYFVYLIDKTGQTIDVKKLVVQ